MAALDTDGDGELSAAEIANASKSLLKLDKNGDGKLSAEELMPTPPGGTNQFRFAPTPRRETSGVAAHGSARYQWRRRTRCQ